MKHEMAAPKMLKRVEVEKADNGYVVSCNYGEKKSICKDMDEVMKAIQSMMGNKPMKKEHNEMVEDYDAGKEMK